MSSSLRRAIRRKECQGLGEGQNEDPCEDCIMKEKGFLRLGQLFNGAWGQLRVGGVLAVQEALEAQLFEMS